MISLFILYCTTISNEMVSQRKAKTLVDDDIFNMLNEVGLE
jgi:hypothetical protein